MAAIFLARNHFLLERSTTSWETAAQDPHFIVKWLFFLRGAALRLIIGATFDGEFEEIYEDEESIPSVSTDGEKFQK